MDKIALLTIHNSTSCGASLQASALYEVLARIGFEPTIINYCPPYFTPLVDQDGLTALRTPKNIVKLMLMGRTMKRNLNLFRSYGERYYPNMTRRFDSLGQIDLRDYDFKYYICGSDQVWNPSHVEYDSAWMFSFVDDVNAKIFSYAASIGKDTLVDADYDWLREGLVRFDKIGVREDVGVNIVKRLGFEAIQNVDPTLLINREEWRIREIEPKCSLPRRYILHYTIEPNPIEFRLLERLKQRYGLECVTMTESAKYALRSGNRLSEYGPSEFLYLIDNAEIVFTNSFHGLVFSMLFGKKLVSFKNMTKNSRIESLLRLCGLEGYQIPDVESLAARDLDEDQCLLEESYGTLRTPIADSIQYLEDIRNMCTTM